VSLLQKQFDLLAKSFAKLVEMSVLGSLVFVEMAWARALRFPWKLIASIV